MDRSVIAISYNIEMFSTQFGKTYETDSCSSILDMGDCSYS
jgi:hypothetical protein